MKKLCLFLVIPAFGSLSYGQYKIPVSTGQKLHTTSSSSSTITQTVMGQDMVIKSDNVFRLEVVVDSVEPIINLKTTIQGMKMNMDANGQTVNFDSEKKEDMEGMMGKALSPMIGTPFHLYVKPEGGALTDKAASQLPELIKASGTEENFLKLGNELLLALPASLKPGDHWAEETNGEGNNKRHVDYTVVSLNGPEIVVSFKGTESTSASKTIQGMEAQVTANAEFSGEMTVNSKTGVILKKKSNTTGKGVTAIMGQNIDFVVKSDDNTQTTAE
ncbi:MAG TPA: DUF6263 family protein [Sediminibacterium sp.]|nr:DUF6263 family protein [Sediminibacterium sp.]